MENREGGRQKEGGEGGNAVGEGQGEGGKEWGYNRRY